MLDDERVRSDVFVPLMSLSEVRCAAAWELEGHWITATPRPFRVIIANFAPDWRSFNKEGHQVENNLAVCINAGLTGIE